MPLISKFDPWSSPLCTCPPKLAFNPYTGCDHDCLYCYASSYIPDFHYCRPKKDLIQRLRQETAKLRGETISISNSSDPYPNIEAEEGLMRTCLETLSNCNCKVQIITKSPLVVRDSDLLRKMPSMVSMTVTTNDDSIAKLIEPQAPPPSARLEALKILAQSGIPTSARIDPIIPYLNDETEELIETLASIGIKHVTSSTYKVRRDNWQRLCTKMPKLSKKLEPTYFKKGEKIGGYIFLPLEMRTRLLQKIAASVKENGMRFGVCREGLSYMNTGACDGSWLLSGLVSKLV